MRQDISRLKSVSLKLLGGLIGAVFVCLSLISLLVLTETGSRKVVDSILKQTNSSQVASITVSDMRGNLINGMTFNEVTLATEFVDASANSFSVSWNPFSLLGGAFIISQVQGSDIKLVEKNSGAGSESESSFDVEQFSFEGFPIAVAVQSFDFRSIVIESSAGQTEIESLEGAIELGGTDVAVKIFNLAANPVSIAGAFQASLTEGLPLSVVIKWNYAAPLYKGFDSASGDLDVSGKLNALAVKHDLNTPFAISSNGDVLNLLEIEFFQANLTHRADEIRYISDQLPLTVLDDVVVTSDFVDQQVSWRYESGLSYAHFPKVDLTAVGTATPDELVLDLFQASSDLGAIESSGNLYWQSEIRTELRYDLQMEAPSELFEGLPEADLRQVRLVGDLDLVIADNEPLFLETEISSFSGQLNGNPLQGNGNFIMQEGAYRVDQLYLESSENILFLSGELSEEVQLEWELTAPSLAMLDDRLRGAGNARGLVSGPLAQPNVAVQARIAELGIGALEVGVFDLNLTGENSFYEGALLLTNGALLGDEESQIFDDVNIALEGDLNSQTVSARINSDLAELQLSASGGAINLSEQTWAGDIQDGAIESQFGNWRLQGRTDFTVIGSSLDLQPNCWRLKETEACFSGSISDDESIQLAAELTGFPLAEFNNSPPLSGYLLSSSSIPRLPEGISLAGPAHLAFQAQRPGNADWEAQFAVNAEGLQLLLARLGSESAEELAEPQSYNWRNLSLDGTYLDGDWFIDSQAILAENNVDGSNFQLEGVLESSLKVDSENSITGTASAQFQDLGWLEAFIPELSNISGELLSNVNLGGTVAAPTVAGDATIRNGIFTADRLGVSFEDFQTSITGGIDGSAELLGSVSSGDGFLEFSGNVDQLYSADRLITAKLSGSDFDFVSIPDLTVSLTPDLALRASAENIHLSGDLSIPELNLTVSELPTTAINVSRDVVIVDYPVDRPDLANSLEAENAKLFDIPVTADVNINLGPDVSFTGFGLEAGLEGNLEIQQLAGGNNLTYGELEIKDGSYEIYRQRLEINQGKLLFLGAYDNPGLDIRATREANGITAGVQMNGTLRNIRSQLFSTPTLADSDVISVLVTGRPFSQLGSQQDDDAVLNAITKFGLERGQGLTDQIAGRLGLDTLEITSTGNITSSELTVGKYLTPGLFVRYGIGLFDTRSKMAVDYNLSESLILQAETGEFQSVDLTYKVER